LSQSEAESISVVTPTLNAATYLHECLASVSAQHVASVEHLIVDGGSTDRTGEIARQYSDAVWFSRPGLGQSEAINQGLRRAVGEVVAWLNADDLYLAGALPFVLDRFNADPSLDALYGDCEVIGPDGHPLWWERPGPSDFRRMLRRGNYIAQPAVFLRRRVFDDLGYLDESLHYGMDYDFWLRLRSRRIEYVPRPLARFRWHPDSKSARGQMRSWNEFIRIVKRHGGGWTPEIAWAYARCLITIARVRLGHSITGSTPLRPLTRGTV
jgi:glycosyltransferase involved in cell wall biosynthesis